MIPTNSNSLKDRLANNNKTLINAFRLLNEELNAKAIGAALWHVGYIEGIPEVGC